METIHIHAGDSQYKREVAMLAEHFRRRGVTLFTGAGVSIPAGLPASAQLKEGIYSAFLDCLEMVGVATRNEIDDVVRTIEKAHPLERLMDALVSVHGSRYALQYFSVLESAMETFSHRAAASLSKHGFLPNIVTLNFDVLFEQALRRESVSFSWHLPLAHFSAGVGHADAPVSVTKPHGSLALDNIPYQSQYLAATLRYAGDQPQIENRNALTAICSQTPVLLVFGYSDNDWDITPILLSAEWSHVYWCEYVNPRHISASTNKPNVKIQRWLATRSRNAATLFYGDCRTLLQDVITRLGIPFDVTSYLDASDIWRDAPMRNPDYAIFTNNYAATALAAVQLIDGCEGPLFRKLLPAFGNLPQIRSSDRLYSNWVKAAAWLQHAHYRNIVKAIALRSSLPPPPEPTDDHMRIAQCADILSLYYGHISALKQIRLVASWPVHLMHVRRLGKEIRNRCNQITSMSNLDPWIAKESTRIMALSEYYRVDLWHNLAAHLLPFNNAPIRWIVKILFSRIARRYADVGLRYPVIDWEYHYVRQVEARVIAGETIDLATTNRRLNNIQEYFNTTGQTGHEHFVKMIKLLIYPNRSLDMFLVLANTLVRGSTLGTPASHARAILFQRYFWPDSISFRGTILKLRAATRTPSTSSDIILPNVVA